MDLLLVKNGLDISRKKKKFLLSLAACGFTSYGLYRFYHLPVVTSKRKRVLKLLGALFSIAEAISGSAEIIGVVSNDLKNFLQSDSDQIPNSLKQISKIVSSEEFSGSVANVTQALTLGILRGYKIHSKSDDVNANSSFMDKVMDKLYTPAGTGFVSVVVGSFARNLVMAFNSDGQSIRELDSNSPDSVSIDHHGLEENSVPRWVNDVCGNDKCRELIGDCIQLFVSTAVAVYLEKTMDINTYDEFFAGLTNPKHEAEVKDVLVSVCNSAVETLVKASHEVLTSSNSSSSFPYSAIEEGLGATRNGMYSQEASLTKLRARNSIIDVRHHGWLGKVSSTLALPSNRRFVLDVTGNITFEMVRSFLEILLEKVYNALKISSNVVREVVVDSKDEVERYVTAKSSAIATICLSLCLHMLDSVWLLVPS